MNKFLKKSLKVFLWIVAGIVVLALLFAFLLNIPVVQNFAKNKAVNYLKTKTKTEVSLESIKIAFPKKVELNKFYIQDLKKDTLLYAEKLQVNINLLKLFENIVEVNYVKLKNIKANVKRTSDESTFNFSFLVDSFADHSKQQEEKTGKDTPSALKFVIDKIVFEDINLTYRDDRFGNSVKFYLGKLETKIKTFDLVNQYYVIKHFTVNNTSFIYRQLKPLTQPEQQVSSMTSNTPIKKSKLPVVIVQNFSFNDVKVNYNDQLTDINALANINELGLIKLKVDLTRGKYSANDAQLTHSLIKFAFKPAASSVKLKEIKDTAVKSTPLSIFIKNIDLVNNQIQFDNLSAKPVKGLDFNHLKIYGLNFGAKNVDYGGSGIKVQIKNGSMTDRSGFKLNALKGDAVYNNRQIKLSNLILKTPHSQIDNQTELTYASLNDLAKHPERVKIKLSFKKTVLDVKDAAFFSQAIPSDYQNEKIGINASASGYLNDIHLSQLKISGLKNAQIDINGEIKGLPNLKKTSLNLNLNKLYITKSDALAVIPKKTLPSNIDIPKTVFVKGKFTGSIANFNALLNVQTDMGSAILTAEMSSEKGAERYKANLSLNNFNLGKLLKRQTSVGKITAIAQLSGSGLNAKNINARFNATAINADYLKYSYKNLIIIGNYANKKAEIKVKMPDSNVHFNLSAKVDLAEKYPSVKGNISLKRIDLKKLNLYPDDLQFCGDINIDIPTANPDYLNGDVFATGLQLVKDGKLINIDTFQVHALSTLNSNALTLKSELASIKLEGRYQLTKLGNAVINQINKYYRFGRAVSVSPQKLRFAANLYSPKILKDLLPKLTRFAPSNISGYLDTEKDSLLLNAFFPNFDYGDYKIDSIRINIDNYNQKLNYQLQIKNILSPSIALFFAEISGVAANNNLDVNLFLRDRQKKDKYVLGGLFRSINQDFRLSLNPNKLLLDYQKWSISPENYVQFGQSGILANQFNLNQGNQSLSVNSVYNAPKSPVRIEFKNLNIETLTKFTETNSTLLGGIINGTINLKDLTGNPKFESDLTINKLRYLKDELGDLRVVANNHAENAVGVNVSLKGPHELNATGFYHTGPSGRFDLAINLKRINFSRIESLSMNQIKQGKGYFSGNFTVKGRPARPEILGSLKFNDAGFKIALINSFFTIPNQEIILDKEGIKFNRFTLIDSLGKKAVVNGVVYTSDLSNLHFNLDLNTDNFRVMNSTANDNSMFYGSVYLTINIRLKGDMNNPDITMKTNINKGTQFYFALPVSDPSVIDQQGIVEFIDVNAPPVKLNPGLKTDSLNKSALKGINLAADIGIDPDAEFNIIAPSNEYALKIKGEANLIANIDLSGKTSLTGKYELNQGNYNLSFGPIQKSFSLVKGSAIVWTGQPTSANVNITALYNVDAAPIDLLNDPSNVYAKTKIPFQVYLYMKGELLNPVISFKLDLPENQKGALGGEVYNRLQYVNQDPNELNKQVFALLTFGKFIANNPFQSLAGSGVSGLARSSASKLLTEQLNNLASDLIQGVNLDFDINSDKDYSSGSLQQKTDLQVGLSKKLFSDRFTVWIGSSFALEGANANNSKAANIADNINLEYALSKDGRYRLRAYRRNQTDAVIEGQIVETKLGFALVVDYNKFKEIFQSRKNRYKQKTR